MRIVPMTAAYAADITTWRYPSQTRRAVGVRCAAYYGPDRDLVLYVLGTTRHRPLNCPGMSVAGEEAASARRRDRG
jgi:hypothetical protein